MEHRPANRLFSLKESYRAFYYGLRTIKYMSQARRQKLLSTDFIERVMLAVTEVNGCAVCSYAHARLALEAGISSRQIQDMLSGVMDEVPAHQQPAVWFAQHYADSRANPSRLSWDRMIQLYGDAAAKGILGAIRMIMIGNIFGIPLGSFLNRFKGKPDKRSSIFYEIGMMGASIILVPVALAHALLDNLGRKPIIVFKSFPPASDTFYSKL